MGPQCCVHSSGSEGDDRALTDRDAPLRGSAAHIVLRSTIHIPRVHLRGGETLIPHGQRENW
jgi:hypothetical protein